MIGLSSILRASDVKRWHIVNTSRQQNLAEHQWKVSVLAGEIATRLKLKTNTVNMIMVYAMFHDVAEVITGDMPTQTKAKISAATKINVNHLFSSYEKFDVDQAPDLVKRIIKCADHLDGIMFLKDHQVGRHAAQAYDIVLDKAYKYFDRCGDAGKIARKIWDDHLEVRYTI